MEVLYLTIIPCCLALNLAKWPLLGNECSLHSFARVFLQLVTTSHAHLNFLVISLKWDWTLMQCVDKMEKNIVLCSNNAIKAMTCFVREKTVLFLTTHTLVNISLRKQFQKGMRNKLKIRRHFHSNLGGFSRTSYLLNLECLGGAGGGAGSVIGKSNYMILLKIHDLQRLSAWSLMQTTFC